MSGDKKTRVHLSQIWVRRWIIICVSCSVACLILAMLLCFKFASVGLFLSMVVLAPLSCVFLTAGFVLTAIHVLNRG
jgi:hypothetical protein